MRIGNTITRQDLRSVVFQFAAMVGFVFVTARFLDYHQTNGHDFETLFDYIQLGMFLFYTNEV